MKPLLEVYLEDRKRFEAFLFDIDGTLWLGGTPIPGAVELLTRLREDGVPFGCLSNNSSDTRERIAGRLNKIGLPVSQENIVTCRDAVEPWFRNHNNGGKEWNCFLIGNCEDIPGVVRFETDPAKIMECDGVLHNGSVYDWRVIMTAVLNFFIVFPEKPLIVSNPDILCPLQNGFHICSNGQMELVIRLLEERGIRKERILLGKPHTPIYEVALSRFGIRNPSAVAAVGDLLTSDIQGANRNGLTSVLVMTGFTTAEMAETATGDLKPDLVCSRLA